MPPFFIFMDQKIIITGDIHGSWDYLNTLINKHKPDILIACGDFGWFPNLHGLEVRKRAYHNEKVKKWYLYNEIKNPNTKIYWCDGNHENHEHLLQLKDNEIMPNVFYQKRGSVITLPDGRNVMFMGGADSIDKESRTQGINWFPQELITYNDVSYALENGKKYDKIDIVISHTCPNEFCLDSKIKWYMAPKISDTCRVMLSEILKEFHPEHWYFGHWHISLEGVYENCKWTALNCANDTNWWSIFDK